MNKYAMYHKSESEYCYPLDLNTILLRFRTAKYDEDIISINVIYNTPKLYGKSQKIKKMEIKRSDELYSYWEVVLTQEIPSYYYVFEVVSKDGQKHYFTEVGLIDDFYRAINGIYTFRVPFINKSNVLLENKKFKGDVVYEIFPERFNMGLKDKDKSYINRDWNSTDLKAPFLDRNAFLGGDLQGILDKLDYIKGLGVDVIYLTPILTASTNHKYNIEDYYNIDPHFGDNKLFKKLVKTAHKKGLKVIMDLVFNHSAHTHPFFKDILEYGKESKYYDYYMMQEAPLKTDNLNYYTFNSVKYLPKWNTNNKHVQNYFIKVSTYYLKEFKVDGLRLDVANEVCHPFWIKFNEAIKAIDPNCLIIGENWDNAHEYLKQYEFDGVMNYTFFEASMEYFAWRTISLQNYVDKLNFLLTRYPENAIKNSFNLLDSHDVPRFYNYVKGNKNLYLCGLLTLISYPGLPMLYYGDEIFMMGGPDPDNRRGMRWDSNEFNSYHHEVFKEIVRLRKLEVFRDGDILIRNNDDLLVINRFNKYDNIEIVINANDRELDYKVNGEVILSNNYMNEKLYNYGFIVIKN